MAKMPADACRNSVRMPDGHFRSVPSASEVGNYMRLAHRPFPDGTTRLSFSLRGVWTICLNRDYFPRWSGRMLARLDESPGSYVREPGKNGDVFVDAAEVSAVAGESTSRRMRAAMTLVRDAVVADLVRSGVRTEMLAIFALTNDAARTRRIQEVLGSPPGPAPDAEPPAAFEAGRADEAPVDDAEEEPAGQDLDRFVPVVEREVGGRPVLSVVARDVWTFVGAGRRFTDWFKDQVAKCRLQHSDFVEDYVFPETGKNRGVGRVRREHLLTLDAAKEICMMDRGARGKELRLYFLDCERRLAAGEGPAMPQQEVALSPGPQVPAIVAPLPALAAENVPLSFRSFLALKGYGAAYSAGRPCVAASWDAKAHEGALVRRLLDAGVPGHSCCRHPADGHWLFTREALDAWWAENARQVMLASLEG